LVAISQRFNHSNQLPNDVSKDSHKTHPMVMSLRHLSDKKSKSGKRGEPLKLSLVDDEPRLTHTERLKRLIQNYGSTAVMLHIVLSLTSLGSFYTVLYFGVDVTAYIPMHRFGETAAKVMAGSGTFAVAYALHKMIMPIRIAATIALTPVLVKQLIRAGLLKHRPL
jgi:hypothetical protein